MKRNILQRVVKDTCLKILFSSGLLAKYIKYKHKGSALILAYHRVNSKVYIEKNELMPGMYVSDDTFRLHMQWLKNNYNIVSLEEVLRKMKSKTKWEKPLCAITFDDGWYDNYIYAFPILKELGIPATIFIINKKIESTEPMCLDICFEIIQSEYAPEFGLTGISDIDELIYSKSTNRIEQARRLIHLVRRMEFDQYKELCNKLVDAYSKIKKCEPVNDKYKMLSWGNLREMQKDNINYGYHSNNHYILDKAPCSILEDELTIPKDIAKKNGVIISDIFCYPDGKYNNKVISILKKLKYKGAVTLVSGTNGVNESPYELRRFNIHEGGSYSLGRLLSVISKS